MRDNLSSVSLSTFGLRREPPRPKSDREPGYEDKFDFDTLFYDVFLNEDGRQVVALCPLLLNCEVAVHDGVFRLGLGSPALETHATINTHGGVFRFSVPPGVVPETLRLEIGDRAHDVPVQPSECARFTDRRVLFTLSKDNPLPWIRDWATFHVRAHCADAVLFYDNGSTAYSLDAVFEVLGAIDGLEEVLVRPWDFPFGPGQGPNGKWESDFCKEGAFAHARWRYCANARAFLNTDIDELLVSDDGVSVFDCLEDSGLPCLTFAGRWVTAVRPRRRSGASLTG